MLCRLRSVRPRQARSLTNEVYFVPVNASDPDQLGFLQAVIARTDDVAEMQTGARDAGVELTALGITVIGFPIACVFAPLVGCSWMGPESSCRA